MKVRKTIPVYLFESPAGMRRLYLEKETLEEDLHLCQLMLGEVGAHNICELPLVLSEDASSPIACDLPSQKVKARQSVIYDDEFEKFWSLCYPKKGKDRVYAEWLAMTPDARSTATRFVAGKVKDGSVLERMIKFKEEVLKGVGASQSDG